MIFKSHKILTLLGFVVLTLSSCATDKVDLYSQSAAISGKGGTYKVGNPYKVLGKWYYPKEDYNYVETGTASWYGKDFHAKYTANGEIYDMNTLTAAHRTLPLPSIVRVTNLENGRSLVLRVNDRGPFAKNRIIDISKRGAQLLGFQTQGTAKVKVEIMEKESKTLKAALTVKPVPNTAYAAANNTGTVITVAPKAAQSSTATGTLNKDGIFYIQAGSFANKDVADNLKSQLHKYGEINVMPADVNGSRFYRVRVGPFYGKTDANIALLKIKDAGLPDARVIVE